MFKDTHVIFERGTNPQGKRFVVQEISLELCGTVDVLTTVSLQNPLLEL